MSVVEVPKDGDYYKGGYNLDYFFGVPQRRNGEYIYCNGLPKYPPSPEDQVNQLTTISLPEITAAVRDAFPEGRFVEEVLFPEHKQRALTDRFATKILKSKIPLLCQHLLAYDLWPQQVEPSLYDRLFEHSSKVRKSWSIKKVLYEFRRPVKEPLPLSFLISDLGHPQSAIGRFLQTNEFYFQIGHSDKLSRFTTLLMGRYLTHNDYLDLRERIYWPIEPFQIQFNTGRRQDQMDPLPQILGLPPNLNWIYRNGRGQLVGQPLSTIVPNSDWTSSNTVL